VTAHRRPAATIAAALTAALLLTACSNGGGPAPTSPVPVTTTSASTTKSPTGTGDIAPVRKPLNINTFITEPCKTITDPQRQALAQNSITLLPGAPDDRNPTPNCVYGDYQHMQDGDVSTTVAYVDKTGLQTLYDKHTQGYSPDYWSPGELTGHPLVYYSHQGSPESCDVAIATTDTSYVDIQLFRFGAKPPREQGACAATRQIAEATLATITHNQ
jgi:hypothetical protein